MSRATYLPFEVSDPRSLSQANAPYSALATASASVDAKNYAVEGLDRRALETHPVGSRTGSLVVTTRAAANLGLSAAYTQLVHSATAMRLSAPGSIPASLAAGEYLRCRYRLWLETSVGNEIGLGVALPALMSVRLYYNDGTSTVAVPYSTRTIQHWGRVVPSSALFFCEGWIAGPTNLSWMEAQYTLAGAGAVARPSVSCLWATRFRRQNPV